MCYFCAKIREKNMQTVITIDRAKLLQRVRLTLAYNADRNPAVAGRYAEAAMTTNDKDLAEAYWSQALTWAAMALKSFGGEADPDGDSIILSILSPYSVASRTSLLENIVANAVECKIASEWLAVVGDIDSHARYRDKALGYTEEAIDLCNRKTRPY